MKTLFITRPINPPWTEGTKNLIRQIIELSDDYYYLSSETKQQALHVYSGNSWGLQNKLRLLVFLIISRRLHQFDQFVLAFSPSQFTAQILALICRWRNPRARIVQFIPSLPQSINQHELSRILVTNRYIVISDTTYYKISKHLQGQSISIFKLRPFINPQLNYTITTKDILSNPTVVYPGEYSSRLQAFPLILDIIKCVVSQRPNIHFVLACRIFSAEEQSVEKQITNWAQQHGYSQNITQLNETPKIFDLIGNASIVIFPAVTMGNKFDIPLVLIESLFFNTPVLISDIQPLAELYKHDHALQKEFTLPLQPSVWCQKIINLLDKPHNLHSTDRLKHYVQQHFMLAQQANKLVDFLDGK